jgi:hypothetical protein
MKIAFTTDQVLALEKALNQLNDLSPITTEHKVAVSICKEIAEKVNKSYRKVIKETDLFAHKKKTKIELSFHQIWALFHYVNIFLPTVQESKYDRYKQSLQQINDLTHQIIC